MIHHAITLLLLWYPAVLFPEIRLCRAFSMSQPDVSPPRRPPGSSTEPNKKSFHKVLEEVGKTVFRPGGSEATDLLQSWAELDGDSKVLELAAGLGKSGMALVERYGCSVLLTDVDESRLEQAQKLAVDRGMSEKVQTRTMDMTNMALADGEHFDCACIEASLTHMADPVKHQVLRDLEKRDTSQVLLHEVMLRCGDEATQQQVKRDLGSALAIGFHPLTEQGWKDLVEQEGYTVSHVETGPLRSMRPSSLLRDEGFAGVAKIAWNLLTRKDLRSRVKETKAVMDANSENLGYVVLRAVKKETRQSS